VRGGARGAGVKSVEEGGSRGDRCFEVRCVTIVAAKLGNGPTHDTAPQMDREAGLTGNPAHDLHVAACGVGGALGIVGSIAKALATGGWRERDAFVTARHRHVPARRPGG
jgi:hypothetical protein